MQERLEYVLDQDEIIILIEMNTRIQVEHYQFTEMVDRVDLIRDRLELLQIKKLSL